MANFNGAEEAMGSAFKTPNNLLCPCCGEYGRVSFPVFVEDQSGQNLQAANSVVCLMCNKRLGRLIGLFTGPVAKPDILCRDAKLPAGCSLEGLRRVLEKEPLRRWFHYTELGEHGRNQLF